MTIRIKPITNGWLVNYDTFTVTRDTLKAEVTGNSDKAFTYEFQADIASAFDEMMVFVRGYLGMKSASG